MLGNLDTVLANWFSIVNVPPLISTLLMLLNMEEDPSCDVDSNLTVGPYFAVAFQFETCI